MYIVDKPYDDCTPGTLRHAASIGANALCFAVPTVALTAPVEFNQLLDVTIYGMTGNQLTTLTNYGLVFKNCQRVLVHSLAISAYQDDGIRLDQVDKGQISHCLFMNSIPNSDEAVSAVHGCKQVEIDYCQFTNVKKCILLGTGDSQNYLIDRSTLVSIHNNIFFNTIERRTPYGTGTILYTGNWVLGWKYQGVQSFGLRVRQQARCYVDNNIFEQASSYWDGFPNNQLSKGGANQAVTVEDDARVHITERNIFTPSWLTHINNTNSDIISDSERSQLVASDIALFELKQHLLVFTGPKEDIF